MTVIFGNLCMWQTMSTILLLRVSGEGEKCAAGKSPAWFFRRFGGNSPGISVRFGSFSRRELSGRELPVKELST